MVIPGFTCEMDDPDPLCGFPWDLALIRAGVWRVHARYGAEHCFSLVCGGRRARLVRLLTKLLKVAGSVCCFRPAHARFVVFICRLHDIVMQCLISLFESAENRLCRRPVSMQPKLKMQTSDRVGHLVISLFTLRVFIYIFVYIPQKTATNDATGASIG